MARVPRSTYHHGNLRQALLDAGRQELRGHGAAGLSLRRVARVTGVSQAAPYRHFDDRNALLAALAAEGFLELHHRFIADDRSEDPPRCRLERLGRTYVRFALDEPALFQLMFSAELDELQARDDTLRSAGEQLYGALQDAVRGLVPDPEQFRVGCASAWSIVHGMALLLLHGRLPADRSCREQLVDAVTAQFALGLERIAADACHGSVAGDGGRRR